MSWSHELQRSAGQSEAKPSRREFLRMLGGGIIVYFALGERLGAAEDPAPEAAIPKGSRPTDFNAYLRIGADGRVTCLSGKIEMGQGPVTSLPQMLAEELDVPVDSVNIVMGDTDVCPWDAGTWGSLTTRRFGPILRAAAAEARAVLTELAAEKLGAPVGRMATADGAVFVRDEPAHRVTYAALAQGRTIERHLTRKPDLKDPSQFRVMGKSLHRRDALEKVTGRMKYTADIRVPGMLYASVLRPPGHGATLKSVDTRAAESRPGVRVIHNGDLVATLHESPEAALSGLALVKAEWNELESNITEESIHTHLASMRPDPHVVSERGDLKSGRQAATRAAKTTYQDGYVAHAAMETHAALAQFDGDRMTVWASTQNPFGARDQVAAALAMPIEKVRIITPTLGGGFGGKTDNLQVVEAARLAMLAGAPVQVMRTREEEFFLDTFRPASIITVDSGIDNDGRIAFWDYEVCFAGERAAAAFYAIPHQRTIARPRGWTAGPGTHPFPTGAWRAPSANSNGFARESQIDVLAALASLDPVEFRLRSLKDPHMIRTLRAATKAWGWTPAVAPSGRGWGVACATDAGTYVAVIAEVAVDERSGDVQVKRVLVAQDMGLVVNPQGATLQVEGCVIMGLGYALLEEVRFKGGQVLDTNFSRYSTPRFKHVPKIETLLLERPGVGPQGGGEPAITGMGGAIANAIFDATGARVTRMPMTPRRVKEAMSRK